MSEKAGYDIVVVGGGAVGCVVAARLRSADPSAAPRIDLGYFGEPRDLDRLANDLIRIREPAGTGPIAGLSRGEELAPGPGIAVGDRHRLRQWIRNAWTHHHAAGTCAMGSDQPHK